MASIGETGRRGAPARRRRLRLSALLPKGLYGRSLIIIIAPMVILQSVLAFVFMERHWQTVTQRLSAAVTRDIAAIIDLYEAYPHEDGYETLRRIAFENLGLNIAFLPLQPLPASGPTSFFSIIDEALSREIRRRIDRPFWIDTVSRSNLVEIRIQLADATLRVFARRNQTYASNSHIFLVWMVGTSLVLLAVAILFLRNQIRPIQTLADAAESFGKGRPAPVRLRPRGAREVRKAAQAFLQMRERIERHVDQRTAMLAGVSHDLRTVLTRFRLQLAMLEESEDVRELLGDVDEMSGMLEAYLAFARGDEGEIAAKVDLDALLESLRAELARTGCEIVVRRAGDPVVDVKPTAFKRCLSNLAHNASRYADHVEITAIHADRWLTVEVEDDGPGIPEESLEEVFRPFYRLDDARNQDEGGTGLGLAIARDIARAHGGDIVLGRSAALGGLAARVRLPV